MHTSSGKYCDGVVKFGDTAKCTFQDSRFFTVVWLGIQVFWDVTLCCWANSSFIKISRCLQVSSLMLKGEGISVLPNTWNHSSDTALHLRRLVPFKNALVPGTGMGGHIVAPCIS